MDGITIGSTTISYISGWPNTDEQQNIISSFVTSVGCGSGLDVFQMPCRTCLLQAGAKLWPLDAIISNQAMLKPLITYILIITSLYACRQDKHQGDQKEKSSSITIELKKGKDTFQYFSFIDTNYYKYKFPVHFKKPDKWLYADKERMGMLGDWYGGSYSDTFDLPDALALIDTATDMSFGSAKSWCIKNYKQSFPYLVTRLSDKRKIGLKYTADLIIWDRIASGDLEFYGHGGIIIEDVFTIAGRVSWILNQLTGESFAEVHGNLTKQDAEKYKQLWLEYLNKIKK
ncbi:MAG: hypothetical protein JNK27_16130 [Chitinophagaceae bacterium]|nr:hypothetical protein [Chitinophagaceae bacterium]